MADLIDRDELRKDFCNMCEAMQPEMIDCEKKGCMSMQIIDEQPAVNRWIPCSERLPETPHEGFGVHFLYSDCVLVAAKNWMGMAYYLTEEGKSWWEFADAQTKQRIDWVEVTHWMPLPEPPEKE